VTGGSFSKGFEEEEEEEDVGKFGPFIGGAGDLSPAAGDLSPALIKNGGFVPWSSTIFSI